MACRPSAASRTTTASVATRRCPTTRISSARADRGVPAQEAGADLGVASELHRAVHAPHDRGREGVRGAVEAPRPVGRLVDDLRDHRHAGAARVAGGLSAPVDARPRVSGGGADAVGHRFPYRRRPGRARGSRAARRLSPAPLRAADDDAGAAIEIETTRPELVAACVALVAHPDDERYKPLFGRHVVTPLFGVRVPVLAHPLADPEKGSGIAMICTFGDVTDVTWWRELSLPVRAIVSPDGTLRDVVVGRRRLGVDRRAARDRRLRPARRSVGRQGPDEDRRAAAGVRRDDRRAAADHARREVLREGRPSARDHHEPAVVLQDHRRSATRCCSAAPSCGGIRRTCRRASRTGPTA